MKLFSCQSCGHTVFFENTHCVQCDSALGFIPEHATMSALVPAKKGGWLALIESKKPTRVWEYCSNHEHKVCNWLVEKSADQEFCIACEMNRYIPNPVNIEERKMWRDLEFAKHRLIYSLIRLKLPLISKDAAPESGMSFDFITDARPVPEDALGTTGHADGQVTINMAEANPAEREQMRKDMNESYRTLIGHFRHEIGHYYWDRLILNNPKWLKKYRALFGDERADYGEALAKHYKNGAVKDWQNSFVSTYAGSHPWEDWAETWAHYFHIVDTLETAYSFGITLTPQVANGQYSNMTADIDPYLHRDFEDIINRCIPLTFAVNSLNRGMGQPDLYPFVLTDMVKKKLTFVHKLMLDCRKGRRAKAPH